MKLLAAIAIAALSLPFGANAFAQTSSHGLTRAEVNAQLHEAQVDGVVPTRNNDYPPSTATVQRNRELYAIQHGTDGAKSLRTADQPTTQPGAAAD